MLSSLIFKYSKHLFDLFLISMKLAKTFVNCTVLNLYYFHLDYHFENLYVNSFIIHIVSCLVKCKHI